MFTESFTEALRWTRQRSYVFAAVLLTSLSVLTLFWLSYWSSSSRQRPTDIYANINLPPSVSIYLCPYLSLPAGCRAGWIYKSVLSMTVAATRTAMQMTARQRPVWTHLCPPWYALIPTCALWNPHRAIIIFLQKFSRIKELNVVIKTKSVLWPTGLMVWKWLCVKARLRQNKSESSENGEISIINQSNSWWFSCFMNVFWPVN